MSKILVIADIALDHYVFGEASKLCPEAPVGVLKIQREEFRGGMGENVLNNLIGLSKEPKENFDIYCSDCANKKTRYVDVASGYLMLRVDDDCIHGSTFNKEAFATFIKEFKPNLIYVSDYCKGFISKEDIQYIAEFCEEKEIITVLDTKLILGDWSKAIDYVKINKKEYENQLSNGVDKPNLFCKNLIITRAGEGTEFINSGGSVIIPTRKVAVSDVTGAGDCFGSAFSIKLMESGNPVDAIKFANAAASLSVTKQGVVTLNRNEVEEFINHA